VACPCPNGTGAAGVIGAAAGIGMLETRNRRLEELAPWWNFAGAIPSAQ
jgi:hypothetical protein